MDKIFSVYNDLNKAYNFDNFKIVEVGNSNICYVFITGNVINPRRGTFSFYEKNKNDFEWMNVSRSKKVMKNAGKYIFIKDYASKFYLYGCNHNLNSIDKIIEFIKNETVGYDVYFAGYSGGAYLSLIIGSKIENTKRIYSFGPIYNVLLWDGVDHSYTDEDKDYFRCCTDKEKSKFFDITGLINKISDKTISFYGTGCDSDVVQQNYLEEKKVFVPTIPINTTRHCGNLSFYTIVGLLSCKDRIFKKIQNFKSKTYIYETKILLKVNLFKLPNYIKYRLRKKFSK